MKRLRIVGDLLLIAVAIVSTFSAIFFFYMQATFVTITSGSMEPALKVGDVAITERVPRLQIQKGDILVLPHPENERVRFAHRVVVVDRNSGETVIETKGDANPAKDAWRLKVTSAEVPKISAVLHRPNFFFAEHPYLWAIVILVFPTSIAMAFSFRPRPTSSENKSAAPSLLKP